MEIRKVITLLEEEADKECSCTHDQQTGTDVTVCISCTAGGILNDASENLENDYIAYVSNYQEYIKKYQNKN